MTYYTSWQYRHILINQEVYLMAGPTKPNSCLGRSIMFRYRRFVLQKKTENRKDKPEDLWIYFLASAYFLKVAKNLDRLSMIGPQLKLEARTIKSEDYGKEIFWHNLLSFRG
jgi:hypothetical protein